MKALNKAELSRRVGIFAHTSFVVLMIQLDKKANPLSTRLAGREG
jgi:hypothetical protein